MPRKQKVDTTPDIELGGIEETRPPSLESQARVAELVAGNGVVQTNANAEMISPLAGIQVVANNKVTQTALRLYLDLQREAADVQAEIAARTAELNIKKAELEARSQALQEAFLAAWDSGLRADTGPGKVTLNVVEQAVRTSPKWKDEALILATKAGLSVQAYEASVLDKYKKPSIRVVKVL